MRIVDVTTTHLHAPDLAAFQAATMREAVAGRGQLFVHIKTDEGHEGLGKGKIFGVPLYRLLGPYQASVPVYGSGGWTSLDEAGLVREQAGWAAASAR